MQAGNKAQRRRRRGLGSARSASSFNWIFPPLVPSRLLLPSNSENKTFVWQTLSLLSFLTSFGSLVVFSANVSPTQTESRRTSSQGRSRSQMRSERASLGSKKKKPKARQGKLDQPGSGLGRHGRPCRGNKCAKWPAGGGKATQVVSERTGQRFIFFKCK